MYAALSVDKGAGFAAVVSVLLDTGSVTVVVAVKLVRSWYAIVTVDRSSSVAATGSVNARHALFDASRVVARFWTGFGGLSHTILRVSFA